MKDWQITGKKLRFWKFINIGRKIPITVYTELIYAPEGEVYLDNIEFIDKDGINTPYLITEINNGKVS